VASLKNYLCAKVERKNQLKNSSLTFGVSGCFLLSFLDLRGEVVKDYE
jgi:hypothetical protein